MKRYNVLAAMLLTTALSYAQNKPAYHISGKFSIKDSGGYDYMTVDSASEKLYVSNGSQVNILNKNTGDSLGVIKTQKDVHGIALVHALGKGYISNGTLNKVLVFDLVTNKILKYVPTGKFADAIFYDDFSKKVITCNGMSKNMTVIDPANDTVVATIQLSGWPETAVSDGKGNIYVNNAEKAEMDVIDATTFKITHHWPNKPGTGASGLAIDRETMRLFATCGNKRIIVMDASNGNVVTSFPIGEEADGAGFDNSLKTVYSSNGEGTLTVIKELSADKFILIGNVVTKPGARTITVDQKTHKVYLPSGLFKPASKETFRPEIIPGTFKILAVEMN
ncbi:YncE family protein [Ferruginibacter sp.]|uniref:YncE family protein n=1 Tax=Ferruginibacter sp. TaxID=1940288 RepID=UPI0026586450|nr:YncE family protein [Ferruginibacter sp.]